MNVFKINDSGKRKVFSTGMQRDSEDKIRYDLIPIEFLERFAEHLTKGAKKYSPNNWKKAETPEELDRFIQSLWRHMIAYVKGEEEEDHMAAITFNLCGAELVKEKLGPDWQEKLRAFQLDNNIDTEPKTYTVHDVNDNTYVIDENGMRKLFDYGGGLGE